MLGFITNFIQSNFIQILIFLSAIFLFTYKTKIIKYLLLFSIVVLMFVVILRELTVRELISNKAYNFVSMVIYFLCLCFEEAFDSFIIVRDQSYLKLINLLQILLINKSFVIGLFKFEGLFFITFIFSVYFYKTKFSYLYKYNSFVSCRVKSRKNQIIMNGNLILNC